MKGIFRAGWQADYPSIENFLTPLYSKGAFPPGSNWVLYDNPEFEKLLPRRPRRRVVDEANSLYQQAEACWPTDFPSAPLWYPNLATAAWSDKVTDVQVNAFGVLDFAAIKVK